jgi:glycine dehydrogenase subunit 1
MVDPMPYLYNTPDDEREMLSAIGVSSIAELFEVVPRELRLERDLNLPGALSELELTQHMASLADGNRHVGQLVCFLGAGSYDHFIPAAVDALAARGEFYTSYTPYQAEVSQGNLQVMFEYQTLVARLTGMDVSNSSLYDGGSATAEAVLMAMSATKRHRRVVTSESVHPEYRRIVQTYLANLETELITVGAPQGQTNRAALADAVDEQVACVLVQHPNFFGGLEDVRAMTELAHRSGALVIQVFDPISLGLLRRPGDYGVDIAVAEGQALGSDMAYGGPYLGMLACRSELVRRMPGRIVGQTVDRRGQRCFVLTLQTREQHIRREKATSNICTNQGLLALRATIYLALLGPRGLRELAELCLRKARYAAERITAARRWRLAFSQPTFKEFVVRDTNAQVRQALDEALREGYLAGVPLDNWYPELADCWLMAVTEKRTRHEIDSLAACLANMPSRAMIHA